MLLKKDIQSFLDYCELTKQYTDNTIRNYQNTLKRFLEYCLERKITRTEEIDLAAIEDYRKYLNKKSQSNNKKRTLKTQSYQIVVIRSLLKFLSKKGLLVLSPEKLELPKTRMRRIEFLTDQEITKLVLAIVNDTKKIPEVQKKRNKAIVATLFGSGLRLSEMLALNKSDITNALEISEQTPNKPTYPIHIQGKGGKIRTTFLSPQALASIQEYLQLRGEDEIPYLFIAFSRNRPKDDNLIRPLTPRLIQMMIKEYSNRVGIFKHVTPHTLRHSFATKILSKTGDLRTLQELLGHSNIATTQIYTHVTDWQIRDLHSKVFDQ